VARRLTMAKPRRIHVHGENRLLTALPRQEYDRLLPDLEKVPVNLKDILHEANGPITHVVFPLSGVVSLVLVMEDGLLLEVGTVGNEGLVGIPAFLGADRSSTTAICHIPGEALRMEAQVFQEEMRRAGPLHGLVQRATQALLHQLAQTAACNHRHSVQQRMCRWLLLTHDRVGADDLPLTQEFLAQMLCVRRPTLTAVAGALQNAGLISYHRGRMSVLDRKGLEAASCECYRAVRKEIDRLLG
jgi:CRP-like cAMP-binding protein